MKYLTAKEVLIVHALLIDEIGGSHGIRDLGLLQAAVHKPQAMFAGKELYKNIFQKSAVLLEALVSYHVFIDGNKRTALTATARFLHENKYELTASNKEVAFVVLEVATKEINIKKLEIWIKKNCRKI